MRKFNRIVNTIIPNNSNESSDESIFCKFGYVDYIVLASTIAIALGEELSATDLNILASFFAVLSDELALVSAVEVCDSNTSDNFTFVPPDVAMTNNVHKKNKNRTVIRKKIVKRKVKRKKNT